MNERTNEEDFLTLLHEALHNAHRDALLHRPRRPRHLQDLASDKTTTKQIIHRLAARAEAARGHRLQRRRGLRAGQCGRRDGRRAHVREEQRGVGGRELQICVGSSPCA